MRLSVTVSGCFPRIWVDSDAFWTTRSEGLRCRPRLRRILDQCQPGALRAVRRLGLTHASGGGTYRNDDGGCPEVGPHPCLCVWADGATMRRSGSGRRRRGRITRHWRSGGRGGGGCRCVWTGIQRTRCARDSGFPIPSRPLRTWSRTSVERAPEWVIVLMRALCVNLHREGRGGDRAGLLPAP